MHTKALVLPTLLFLVSPVLSICPGFNFGIGEGYASLGPDYKRWDVHDANCNIVDAYGATRDNPCTSGKFGCTPPPVTFNWYKARNGLEYKCRPDPNSGSCNGRKISVCCRNDGN